MKKEKMKKQKTYLILALPGSGKTTWAKQTRQSWAITDRPVIDFDYYAPRRSTREIKVAQSKLLNAWARAGVRAIVTFAPFLDYKALDPELFKIIFVMPERYDDSLVKRAEARNPDNFRFLLDYKINFVKWWDDWKHIYDRIRSRRKFDVEWRTLHADQYLSYVVSDVDASLDELKFAGFPFCPNNPYLKDVVAASLRQITRKHLN